MTTSQKLGIRVRQAREGAGSGSGGHLFGDVVSPTSDFPRH